MITLYHIITILILFVCCFGWSPINNRLKTRWASEVNPNNVWPEYPRPQLKRENNWINLNGLWNYIITSIEVTTQPIEYDGEILVPFPVESSLSGVQKAVNAKQSVWYHKSFNIPRKLAEDLVIIHFGAVDYHTSLYINGQSVDEHIGGYDSFSFDITKYITTSNEQTIVLRVTDSTSDSQPIGKQRLQPKGIFHTSSTGIWQTVWLEIVPKQYITSIKINTDIDRETVEFVINTNTPNDHSKFAEIKIMDIDLKQVASHPKYEINSAGRKLIIPNPILWSTNNPYLYTIQIKYCDDIITSYFGMRKIEVKMDANNIQRFFLNNKPIFMLGPLDHGYWPDGVYVAPNLEALKYDLEVTKQFGFNTIKKHVKVEPDLWYYWTDKMGILVWQDFPSAFDNNPNAKTREQIESEMHRIVTQLYNHPSIVMWVLFNAEWGKYDPKKIVNLFQSWDQSRLINEGGGSAHANRNLSKIWDVYGNNPPNNLILDSFRATVITFGIPEFKVNDHVWDSSKNTDLKNKEELEKYFIDRVVTVRANAIFGLGSAIFVQLCDVETEINGLMTYDRAVIKVNSFNIKKYVDKLFPFQTVSTFLLKAGYLSPNQEWNYTYMQPIGDWMDPNYNSIKWDSGKAGFGSLGTTIIAIHTYWNTADIWLRKQFDITKGKLPKHPVLHIFYDEYATVYINGVEILENLLKPFQVGYAVFDIETNLLKYGKM